jgi:dTDP-glucose pyrophosphorylase
MAGAGSRFEQAGYTFPKPLIEVNGKPMIQVVVENLNIDANYIFIVQKNHREKYNLDSLLNLIAPNCKIVEVDGITEGAACTALLAKEFINNDDFYIEEIIRGQYAWDVLSTMQYNPQFMAVTIKNMIDKQVKRGKIKPREGVELIDFYEQCLNSYTYLS